MHSKASLVLGFSIMIFSAWAMISATAWPWKAALFPLVIGIPVFCLAAAEVLWVLLGSTPQESAVDFQLSTHLPRKTMIQRTLVSVGWIVGFFAAIVLVGFPIAVPLFVFLYLKLQGREGRVFSAVFTLAVWVFFYGLFDQLLHLPFPDGLIQVWSGLN